MSPFASRFLAAAILCASLGSVAPASAVTETVGPGGTVRTSTDAAPSPATPIIGSVTAHEWAGPPPGYTFPPCTPETPPNSPCGPPSSTFTIELVDPRGGGGFLAGGVTWLGEALSIKGEGEATQANNPNPASATIDIDRSIIPTGWLSAFNQEITGWPTPRLLNFSNGATQGITFTDLPDGDVRMHTTTFIQRGGGVIDPVAIARPRFGVQAKTASAPREHDPGDEPMTLPGGRADAARKGLPVVLVSNYLCTMTAKVTVTRAVATKLKLKGTTLGTADFGQKQCNRAVKRIPLIRPAADALKKARSAVQVAVNVVSTSVNGETAKNTQQIILK